MLNFCLVVSTQNRLTNGVTAADRYPLLVPREGTPIAPLSPLTFLNLANGEESRPSFGAAAAFQNQDQAKMGSFFNMREVEAVKAIVRSLLIHGILPSQIGVIVPYRQQEFKMKEAVHSIVVQPTVMQPVQTIPVKGKRKTTPQKPAQPSAKANFASSALGRPLASDAAASSSADLFTFDATRDVSGGGVQVSTVDAFQGE